MRRDYHRHNAIADWVLERERVERLPDRTTLGGTEQNGVENHVSAVLFHRRGPERHVP